SRLTLSQCSTPAIFLDNPPPPPRQPDRRRRLWRGKAEHLSQGLGEVLRPLGGGEFGIELATPLEQKVAIDLRNLDTAKMLQELPIQSPISPPPPHTPPNFPPPPPSTPPPP